MPIISSDPFSFVPLFTRMCKVIHTKQSVCSMDYGGSSHTWDSRGMFLNVKNQCGNSVFHVMYFIWAKCYNRGYNTFHTMYTKTGWFLQSPREQSLNTTGLCIKDGRCYLCWLLPNYFTVNWEGKCPFVNCERSHCLDPYIYYIDTLWHTRFLGKSQCLWRPKLKNWQLWFLIVVNCQ